MKPLILIIFPFLALFLCACGGPKLAEAPEWPALAQLDTDLAHAVPSIDAPALAKAALDIREAPKGVANVSLVTTMLSDLNQLGTDLSGAETNAQPELVEAMHVLVGKILTEAGLDVHDCDHDHHDHDPGPEESGEHE